MPESYEQAAQTGRLRDRFSRWVGRRHGVPTGRPASTLEVQAWVLARFERTLTALIVLFNLHGAALNRLDLELRALAACLSEARGGLQDLYRRSVGQPELRRHGPFWPWATVVAVAATVDWILLRPAMTWAQATAGETIGPFQLGRDGAALGASLVLLVLAKLCGTYLRQALVPSRRRIARTDTVTTAKGVVTASAEPIAYTEASQGLLLALAGIAGAAGLGLCMVLGMLREHSENLLAGAGPAPLGAGLLQAEAAPEATPLWVFVGLTAALFVTSALVAAKTVNPYADAVGGQRKTIAALEARERKLIRDREKALAERANLRRRITELIRRARLDLQVARAQQMPQSIGADLLLAPALTAPDEGRIAMVTEDDVQAMIGTLSMNGRGEH